VNAVKTGFTTTCPLGSPQFAVKIHYSTELRNILNGYITA